MNIAGVNLPNCLFGIDKYSKLL